ncbi:MAG: hypothetical protein IJU31_03925 [Synergistaceae bacterium]|nr:hypothetical protein [Synergistaceae bacterium]
MLNGNFLSESGMIVYRDLSGEKNLWMKIFLRGSGIINVTAKKAGGDTEPLLWGKFTLRKKQRSSNYFVEDFEVVDDMLKIRQRKDSLFMVFRWLKLVIKFLAPYQPDDELLANLYWSMKLLSEPVVPVEAASWKFLWRWISSWGLAPDLVDFHASQNFNHDEIVLLAQISMLSANDVIKLFSGKLSPNIRENSFKIASSLAEKFLIQK